MFLLRREEITSSSARADSISICFKGKVKVQASFPFPHLCLTLPLPWARQALPQENQSTRRRYSHAGRLVSRIKWIPEGMAQCRCPQQGLMTSVLIQHGCLKGLHTRAPTPCWVHYCPSTTHPRIRSWPGFPWHYRELSSPNSLISAQNCCCFYSSNKAGTTVYIVRHCKE